MKEKKVESTKEKLGRMCFRDVECKILAQKVGDARLVVSYLTGALDR